MKNILKNIKFITGRRFCLITGILISMGLRAQDVSLYFGSIDQELGTMEVILSNTTNVTSFGIQLTGITLTGASGGSAEEYGLIIDIIDGNIVTGFGFGDGIPPSENEILVNIEFSEVYENETCINPELSNVFGGPDGLSLDFTIGDCYPLELIIFGCTDETACNYNPDATDDDGSCEGPEEYYDCDSNCVNDADGDEVCDELEIPGCTDETACNYNPDATDDDGSCEGPAEYYDCAGNCVNDIDGDSICDELEIPGCTDETACNYNPDATDDNESCEYPDDCFNCLEECICEEDCAGICGGNTEFDECGICDGDNSSCTGCLDIEAVNYCEECSISCEGCCEYEAYISFLSPAEGDTIIAAGVEISLNLDINIGDQFRVEIDGIELGDVYSGDNFIIHAVSVGSNLFNPRSITIEIQTVDSTGIAYLNPESNISINLVFTPPEEFFTVQSTSQAFYFLYDATIDGISLEYNDWIGAFCNTTCVGNKWWYLDVTDPPVTIPAFGDDGSFPGFCNSGDEVTFRMYDHSESAYYNMDVNNIDPDGGWSNFGFYNVDSLYALVTDCNGEVNGSAFIDDCDVCCGGDTGVECSYFMDETDFGGAYDCAGICNGDSEFDECDVCDGGNFDCSDEINECICAGCTENEAENYDPDAIIDNGSCLYQYTRDFYEGQNLVSFWALPEDTYVGNVMTSLDDCVIGVIGEGIAAIKQEDGSWIGSLSDISYYSGYWVNTEINCAMTFTGIKSQDLVYDLHDGANLISFPDPGQIGIGEGIPDEFEPIFINIIGEGIAASQVAPFTWVGSLQNWSGSDGYWVTLSEELLFSFNLSDGLVRATDLIEENPPVEFVQSIYQAFYFVEEIALDQNPIENGDWIIAFNKGIVVGARQWNGKYTDIPAMGYFDESTEGYCNPGDVPVFKLFKKDSNEIIKLSGDIPDWQENGIYMISLTGLEVDNPLKFSLSPVYPNPFNPSVEINISLTVDGFVELSAFNVIGQEVAAIFSGFQSYGYYSYKWNASDLPSGVYYIQLRQGSHTQTTKAMLMK